ncbi:MAG: hypothetical protein WDW36_002942 [Sanguina aurantia]
MRRLTLSKSDELVLQPVFDLVLSVVVLGASGDLAMKKTYPALFALFEKGFLPPRLAIIGYARSKMSDEALRKRLQPHLVGDEDVVRAFLSHCTYISGAYDKDEGFDALNRQMLAWESGGCSREPTGHTQTFGKPRRMGPKESEPAGGSSSSSPPSECTVTAARLLYLALPADVYPQACTYLSKHCADMAGRGLGPKSWVRVICEKPFGKDLESSEVLAEHLAGVFSEEQLYRIDHYLGKELAQNMLVMRFANSAFTSFWNRNYISNIQIIFKETLGVEGRGGYFDEYGIIRDVIQNHLIQVLTLVTMELPVSSEPDDVRSEKVKVLRAIKPIQPQDCLLGQYTAADGKPGYLEDPTVPAGSKTPTFAAVKLSIHNERWEGVPIVIKAGKGLNEGVVVVRIQLKTPAASIFGNLEDMRNEMVIKFQPGEAIYMKMVVKKPGLDMDYEMSELDLSYPERYQDVVIPNAYERLILDAIRGDGQHFVRRDELVAAWKIFTPLLHAIDKGEIDCEPYARGTRGPPSMDSFTASAGYKKSEYKWVSKEQQTEASKQQSPQKEAAPAGRGKL